MIPHPQRMWTVWEFRSVDGRQVVRAALPAHGDDGRYQHEYQRIVGTVLAHSKLEALAMTNNEVVR